MTAAGRRKLFLLAGAILGALLVWGVLGLPRFGSFTGPYTTYLLEHAVTNRHASNVVMAVTFDYRGLDTLGEEFILFSAVMGVALLLRASRQDDEWERPEDPQRIEPVRAFGILLVPVVIILGLWLIGHGQVSPGGGFQGGVVLAGAALLLYLAGGYRGFRAATPTGLLDAAESIGAGGYVVFGLIGLGFGSFLVNFLPFGRVGFIDSGGTIAVINAFVGLEVASAFVLLFTEFLEEVTQTRAREGLS